MVVKDIILDSDFDLIIENGDFKVSDSDSQSIELIIDSFIGAWKQFPLCGVGISAFIKSSGQQLALKRAISIQLEADGMTNINISSNSSELLDIVVSADRPDA